MHFDLRSTPPPLDDFATALFGLLLLSGLAGSAWGLIALFRGRVTTPELYAWTFASFTGTAAASAAIVMPSADHDAYYVAFFTLILVTSVAGAGLMLTRHRDEERRQLGRVVYRTTSVASLVWAVVMIAAA